MKNEKKSYSDEEILKMYRNGQEERAYTILYDRFKAMIGKSFSFISTNNISKHDKEDILHNATLGFIHNFKRFKGNSSISTFFNGILKRKYADFYRTKNNKKEIQIDDWEQRPFRQKTFTSLDEEDRLREISQQMKVLKKHVKSIINNDNQVIVTLEKAKGKSYREIINEIDPPPYTSETACRNAVFKAKKKLTKYILENPEDQLIKLASNLLQLLNSKRN